MLLHKRPTFRGTYFTMLLFLFLVWFGCLFFFTPRICKDFFPCLFVLFDYPGVYISSSLSPEVLSSLVLVRLPLYFPLVYSLDLIFLEICFIYSLIFFTTFLSLCIDVTAEPHNISPQTTNVLCTNHILLVYFHCLIFLYFCFFPLTNILYVSLLLDSSEICFCILYETHIP